ncbi:hypothetical protein [Dyella acidisoli]|uniref:Uncharacterized protein n=1 Tax=Dyella acidisoli TaxID=1867834 RepID=A0ABQ5XUA4_9GAMM|nr:hypothetical protein [Dyella acidisoli]GLQ94005.1 hypothetical protein GCM10007901_29560 [Dyella acidisoli]
MKRVDLLKFVTSLFILTFPLLVRGDDALGVINERQEKAFISYLIGGGVDVGLLNGLPDFKQGDLDPLMVVTGRPCILPNRNESLHSVAYAIVLGASQRRMLFQFTLTPAVKKGEAGTSLTQLVRNRSVTQYWVWMAPENPQGMGTVIDFKSLSARGVCD